MNRAISKCMTAAAMLWLAGFALTPATAAEGFPFGLEMTLDTSPQPGSKRIPNLEIGDRGEVRLELWCRGGTGQFSVAGNTVVFVAGTMEDRACSPAQVQADDALLADLGEATTWARRGDIISLIGSRTLRFHLNTN